MLIARGLRLVIARCPARRLLVAAALSGALSAAVWGYGALAKDVVVQVDRRALAVRTFGHTVRDALAQSKVTLRPGDRVVPGLDARLADGLTVTVRRAFPVTLLADGQTRRLRTAAYTVRDALHQAGLSAAALDRVYPDLRAEPWPGAQVRVIRVVQRPETQRRSLPFVTIQREDGSVFRGNRVVKQPGQPGLEETRYRLTFADGRLVSRIDVGTRIVRTPVARIVLVGTRRLIASRGEFAGREFVMMEATAYYPGPRNWGGGVDEWTAIGMRAQRGIVAVDPDLIPLGTRVYVVGYGYALAADVGSAIKGNRIDLVFPTYQEAMRFGRRMVRVYILDRDPEVVKRLPRRYK